MSSTSITKSVRLSSLCVAALLLSCCAHSSVLAGPPKPKPAPKSTIEGVELELRELGSSTKSHEFVVPLDGRIAGWTELYGEQHFCQLDSDRAGDAQVRLRMRCGRTRDLQRLDFDFQVVCTLAPGERTLLAELTAPSAERIQVVATRR
jgi:hypothetical protein